MNILPTSPDRTASEEELNVYFQDVKRWNFDVPYNAFYAFPLQELKGPYRKPYEDFARMAHERGMPACVQIQSTVGFLDDVDIENAQFNTDNTTFVYQHFKKYGKKNFFGSFAAPGWFRYIKTITEILRSYGYDWVVFEEPMFKVDVPGTKDKLYDIFKKRWPGLEYPSHQEESVVYYRLQQLKAEVLLDFYNRLVRFARKAGFEKIGVMPWFFVPTFENTPMETWNTCCHLGKMTFLTDLDFIVVRMQPDNVLSHATISSGGEGIPQIAYLENLAQNLGKPIISVNNPTNEHIPHSADTSDNLVPYSYFARFTLSAAAAGTSGMSRHWYGKDYGKDRHHMELMSRVNPCLSRLGSPQGEIAMIFSYAAMDRRVPKPWTESWKAFWYIAHTLLYREKIPALTFFSGTMEESLERHPETRLLIFNEFCPIPPHEVNLIEEWMKSDSSRRLLFIGSGNGYRHKLDSLYHDFNPRPTEMLRLFGVDTELPVHTISLGEDVCLQKVSPEKDGDFLGVNPVIRCCSRGTPAIKEQSEISMLYVAGEEKSPVIFQKEYSNGARALYAGLSTDGICNDIPLMKLVRFLTGERSERDHNLYPGIQTRSPGILWSVSRNGFMIVSNCGEENAKYKIEPDGYSLWNVRERRRVNPDNDFNLEPLDFHCLKIVKEGERILDLEGQVYLSDIDEKATETVVKGYFNSRLVARLSQKPVSVHYGKNEVTYSLNDETSCIIIEIDIPERGEESITFRF